MKFITILFVVIVLMFVLVDVSVFAQEDGSAMEEDAPALTEEFLPSALLEAVVRRDIPAVRQALENGENVDVVNDNGWSGARFAVTLNDMDLLRALIENGIDLNNPDKDGITPLMAAASAVSAKRLREQL